MEALIVFLFGLIIGSILGRHSGFTEGFESSKSFWSTSTNELPVRIGNLRRSNMMDVFVTILAAIGILFIGFIFGGIFGILKTKLEVARILDIYGKSIARAVYPECKGAEIEKIFLEMYEKITSI